MAQGGKYPSEMEETWFSSWVEGAPGEGNQDPYLKEC